MRLLPLLLCFPLFLCAQTTTWTTDLKNALDQQQFILPQEKSYLRTDRTLYQPGDIIWMAAYLVGSDQQPASASSELMHIELLAPGGQVIQKRDASKINSVFPAEFQLPQNAAGGIYKIRAYTNYQGNFGDKYLFEKTVQVQRNLAPRLLMKLETDREAYGPGDTVTAFFSARNLQDEPLANISLTYELRTAQGYQQTFTGTTNSQGTLQLEAQLPTTLKTTDVQLSVRLRTGGQNEQITRPVPVSLDNIQLKLLPEGGEWIQGLPCRMAFIAKNEFDEPVDVSGTLYDANETPVLTFTSLHDGMGSFEIPADIQTPCRVRLQKPFAGKRVYPLPDPLVGSWQMRVDYQGGEELQLRTQALAAEELQIAVRAAGTLQDCQVWALQKGEQSLSIDVSGLPMGINQITVFDDQLRPVWERLVFLHPQRQLQVSMETDQEQYEYRQQVKLDLKVTDETGKGVPGNFSLAVVDDRLHSFADDKQPNILAQLLLSSELSGKIHEPNFYFDPNEELAQEALDLLLLTHGWRRFHWRELLQQQTQDWQAQVKYPADQYQLRGIAQINYQRLANATIKIDLPNGKTSVQTDGNGMFVMAPGQVPIGTPLNFSYQGFTSTAYLSNMLVNNHHRKPQFLPGNNQREEEKQLTFFTEDEKLEQPIVMADPTAKEFLDMDDNLGGVQLDEVVVTGLGINKKRKHLRNSIAVINKDELERSNGDQLINMDVDMAARAPEFNVHPISRQRTYQARQFAFPQYDQSQIRAQEKVDQRKTIFWQASLQTDQRGKASVQFFTADEMTTYRAVVEGLNQEGDIAYGEHTFSAAPSLAIQIKMPPFATTGDTLLLPILLQNNSRQQITSPLTLSLVGTGLQWVEQPTAEVSIPAGEHQELFAKLAISGREGSTSLQASAGEGRQRVTTTEEIKLYAKGFPREASTSGQQANARYNLEITNPIPGTITAELQVFPDLMGELLAGVDAILAEPNGCFEQTSSANYPNIMVLQYLQKKQELDEKTRTRAWSLLAKGYAKLSSYEVEGGGFSLWGQAPAVPVLTAFGLLQFTDLDEVWPKVDEKLIHRTKGWLSKEFEQNQNLSEVDRAYILYALAKCGDYRSASALADLNEQAASKNSPAYLVAIAARLNIIYGNEQLAKEQIALLMNKFEKDKFGSERHSPSFVHSINGHLATELIAWTTLAALELDTEAFPVQILLEELLTRRYGGGRFGPTQPTVMALQAITAYERAFARPQEGGKLLVSINQGQQDTLIFTKDSRGKLSLPNLGAYLQGGANSISLRYLDTENPLPYSLNVNWQTAELPSSEANPLQLQTELNQETLALSEQLRYSVRLSNQQNEEGYAPIMLLSAPAGLQWQLWQLKEMQDRGTIDYYEFREPYLVIYFKKIDARETIALDFDLTAIVPGSYQAPAATAYLYYRDQQKSWVAGPRINITD